jgi:hypothetical protein
VPAVTGPAGNRVREETKVGAALRGHPLVGMSMSDALWEALIEWRCAEDVRGSRAAKEKELVFRVVSCDFVDRVPI